MKKYLFVVPQQLELLKIHTLHYFNLLRMRFTTPFVAVLALASGVKANQHPIAQVVERITVISQHLESLLERPNPVNLIVTLSV